MTSQVAVYNQLGVAVASDTVTTAKSGNGPKTLGNAEKIFELGPDHKVVVLHWGSTGINDLVHQFHINEWRLSLKGPLPTLEDYVENYRHWSATGPQFHSAASVRTDLRAFIRNHIEKVKSDIDVRITEHLNLHELTEEEFTETMRGIHEGAAKDQLAMLKNLTLFEGMSEVKARELIKKHEVNVAEIVDHVFDGIEFTPLFMRTIRTSAAYVIARAQSLPWDSSIAFIGFGTDDPFCGSISLICRGLVDGLLVAYQSETMRIKPQEPRWEISTFAQGDAIESFLHGINDDLRNQVAWGVDEVAHQLLAENPDREAVEKVVSEKVDYVLEKLENHSWRNYLDPVGRHIANLNIASMATLAESLVGIQAMASQAKDGPASVGGFIEVVIIDRIDGVRWVKRLPRA